MKSERVSRVARRTWNDAKFRELSAAPPNGQTLWLRLLTGPEHTCVPGIVVAWEAGLAQSLGWSPKGFREAFAEAFAKGMAEGDFSNGLIWVPKAIEHNRPESPNVVKGWSDTWHNRVPECALKVKAYWELKAFVEGMGEAFAKAFAKAFGEGYPEGSRDPSPNTRARPSLSSSPDLDLFPDPSDQVLAKDLTGRARAKGKRRGDDGDPVPEPFPVERVLEYGIGKGLTGAQVGDQCEALVLWAKSKGVRRVDWIASAQGWLRRHVAENSPLGVRRNPKAPQHDDFDPYAKHAEQA